MATWPKQCVLCKAEVAYNGEDVNFSGFGPCKARPGKHHVESATYYHPGARDIQDQRDRRKFAPQVVLKPSYPKVDPKTGLTVNTPMLMVQFGDGKLETDDPEIQFYLDQNPGIASGEAGLGMWREIYLNEHQQTEIAKAELANVQRQIKDNQDLLASVKKNVAGGKAASA